MTETILMLAADFPPATREDWLKLVAAVLKESSFEDKLVARTYDGLRIEPLYAGDRAARPLIGRAPSLPWQVMQRVDHPDPAAANAEALHDLENGASGLVLIFAGAIGEYGYGIEPSEAALVRVLDGVLLDAGMSIELDLSPQAKDMALAFAALVKSRGVAPNATNIRFGFDPLGAMAATGRSPIAWNEIAPIFAGLVLDLARQGFKGPFAVADGRPVHAAGGSEAQELGFVLAVAVAYLRAIEAGGVPLEEASSMVFFRLATDADQFLTMAKFRAMRKLWARVEEACGLKLWSPFVAAETAWRMMTKRDPWVNMLRTTVAVFAAGLGGANSITVLPFTAPLGLPDRFARRVARNTQLILIEEANLFRVTDPAAGSGAIEHLTTQLCDTAWQLFKEIETVGGIAGGLETGVIQAKVAKVRAEREAAVARGEDPITGTSVFPDIAEVPVSVLDVARRPPMYPAPTKAMFELLPCIRLAEPFERLRDASDRTQVTTGAPLKIFLANLGSAAAFTARASFAKNFFEAGGIEAITNEGFPSGAEMLAAFRKSSVKLACLCSSDKVYAAEAVEAAKALKHAGATHIYLAGRPGEREAALRSAGVGTFIYAGCDALATLKAAHDILGVD